MSTAVLEEPLVRERARPMPPDDRREAILLAVIPLLRENGRDITTRQIAEAAGVAEGTLFRAFGDKESIIRAAVEKAFDPLPFNTAIRSLDPELGLEEKLAEILRLMRERLLGVWAMISAAGCDPAAPPFPASTPEEWELMLGDVLAPNLGELTVPVSELARYLRFVAFSGAIPWINEDPAFTDGDFARLIVNGIRGWRQP